jgi:hypothetical protein
MRAACLVPALAIAGCALNADVAVEPARAASAWLDRECAQPPEAGRQPFRHTGSRFSAALGRPRHRGVDLIAMEGDEHQTLAGKLAYSAADKDLEHEEVAVFACVDDAWRSLGTTFTRGDGRFELSLFGRDRLPVGMRDLLAYVPGDGTSVRFLAYVAPAGTQAIVIDVDGTITESEDAIANTVLFGDDIGHRPGAPQALAATRQPIIYLTARGDQFTEVTRLWLRLHGFPRGPLRLARAAITPPGNRTVAFKATAMRELAIPIAAGIGNRATDIEAYARAGLPPRRILINTADHAGELRADLSAGRATAFADYGDLARLLR